MTASSEKDLSLYSYHKGSIEILSPFLWCRWRCLCRCLGRLLCWCRCRWRVFWSPVSSFGEFLSGIAQQLPILNSKYGLFNRFSIKSMKSRLILFKKWKLFQNEKMSLRICEFYTTNDNHNHKRLTVVTFIFDKTQSNGPSVWTGFGDFDVGNRRKVITKRYKSPELRSVEVRFCRK